MSLLCGIAMAAAPEGCVPVGHWAAPTDQGVVRLTAREVLDATAKRPVVLLGEVHDRAEHHRWQLQTMAALDAYGGGIALGLEMFPRRVQTVLDRWVAGELTESEFLERSDWTQVWGFDAALYMPLFRFARMNRLPMLALNVERSLVREVGRKGIDAVSEAMREGVGLPAAATPQYLQELHAVYREHRDADAGALDDPAFLRFVAAQQMWDRAMAEAIRSARVRYPERQVVAVMGRGHTARGAVPYQLLALGIADTAVLLPWEREGACEPLRPGLADAVFGVEAPRSERSDPPRPRLGVVLSPIEGGGVRVDQVNAASIAASADLRAGDVLVAIGGTVVKAAEDVQRAVGRQAPGAWLPLRVRRADVEVELVAKFPPETNLPTDKTGATAP